MEDDYLSDCTIVSQGVKHGETGREEWGGAEKVRSSQEKEF
jgi:hypothetical protein